MCIEKCGSIELLRCEHNSVYNADYGTASVANIKAWQPTDYANAANVQTASKWQRRGKKLVVASALLTGSLGLIGASQAAAAPCLDSDGDGWGWDEDTRTSCLMEGNSSDTGNDADDSTDTDQPSVAGFDADDAAGNNASADEATKDPVRDDAEEERVETASVAKELSLIGVAQPRETMCVDDDGDGWGWIEIVKESCEMSAQNPYPTEKEQAAKRIKKFPLPDSQPIIAKDRTIPKKVTPSCASLGMVYGPNHGWIFPDHPDLRVKISCSSSLDWLEPARTGDLVRNSLSGPCVDTDDDGWGWIEATKESCLMQGDPAPEPEVTAADRCREHGGDWNGDPNSGSCEICSDVPQGGIPADLEAGEWAYWACHPMDENTGLVFYEGLFGGPPPPPVNPSPTPITVTAPDGNTVTYDRDDVVVQLANEVFATGLFVADGYHGTIISAAPGALPVCTNGIASDADGDGIGFENGESCNPGQVQQSSTPIATTGTTTAGGSQGSGGDSSTTISTGSIGDGFDVNHPRVQSLVRMVT